MKFWGNSMLAFDNSKDTFDSRKKNYSIFYSNSMVIEYD